MDLNSAIHFIKNPSASLITTGSGDFAGEVSILTSNGTIKLPVPSSANVCTKECAMPCIPQQYTITFQDTDFGNCNACPVGLAFKIAVRRQSDFDLSDYLQVGSSNIYELPASTNGTSTMTANEIALYFENIFDSSNDATHLHDNFGITASVAGGVLTLVIPCHLQVDIYRQTTGSATFAIAETVAGQEAKWTVAQLRRLFPDEINNWIPGQAPDVSWIESCQEVCVISISGCLAPCAVNAAGNPIGIETSNAVHLHTAGTSYSHMIIVNSQAPGFAAFIAALAAAVTACSALTAVGGSSVPFDSDTAANWALGVNVENSGFTFPGTFTVSNGPVSLTVTATSYANLAAQIQGDGSTSITAAFASPNMTITGFGAGAITLRQIG